MEDLGEAIKALKLTEDTMVFFDRNQISPKTITAMGTRSEIPKGVLFVGVKGPPNVQAMSREELQLILEMVSARDALEQPQ